LTYTQGRGRPKIDISREQLAFSVDQGFTAGDMSGVLDVGKRTVHRYLSLIKLNPAMGRGTQDIAASSNNHNVFPTNGKYQNFRQKQTFFRPPLFQQSQQRNSLNSSNNGKI
jgi:hypothetical protein